MPVFQNHYGNLKVARDAPQEVVRAAYKALAQKYHPDRRPNDPESAKIMVEINEAYRVLSDAQSRKTYDEWIDRLENKSSQRQRDAGLNEFNEQSTARTDQSAEPEAFAPRPPAQTPSDRPCTPSRELVELEEAWKKFKSFFGWAC